jgi:hypothetical protein
MVGLPCLVIQCAKLHVDGWTWAVFTRVNLVNVMIFKASVRNILDRASYFFPMKGKNLFVVEEYALTIYDSDRE